MRTMTIEHRGKISAALKGRVFSAEWRQRISTGAKRRWQAAPGIQERFDAKYERVTESGCWLWNAAHSPAGYGLLNIGRRSRFAHRVSYELHKGKIPAGLNALHRCDVPACVNPDHLFLGSHGDNVADKVSKGRQRGPVAKVTPAQVDEIKRSKERTSVLARRYAVSPATIVRYRGPL